MRDVLVSKMMTLVGSWQPTSIYGKIIGKVRWCTSAAITDWDKRFSTIY